MVVPAMSDTRDLFVFVSAFSRELLPTFGRPIMPIEIVLSVFCVVSI